MKTINKTFSLKLNLVLFVGLAVFVVVPVVAFGVTYGSDSLFGQSYGDTDNVSEYGYVIHNFETKCPTGQILVGIKGRYSVPEIDNLGILICRDESGVERQYGQSYGDINNVSEYGHKIYDFESKCPAGEILTGFKGRYSKAEIENMGIIYCTNANGVERQYGQSYGDIDGVSEYGYKISDFEIRCPTGSAVGGFQGRYSKGEVDNFGPLYCRQVVSCVPHYTKQCSNNAVYWYNSCNTKEDLFQQCTANQTCTNGQCVDQNITCSTNSQCGTDGFNGTATCGANGDVYKNYTTYTCNNAGTPSSTCTHTDEQRLFTDCTGNQTCTNGACTAVACSSASDCGTNALEGNPFCQGNSVYKNYRTYTCNNAGTAYSSCSSSVSPQLQSTCTANQTCNSATGACTDQNITCSSASDCGTNAYTGSPYCQYGNVYQNYTTYTCNNAGTSSSSCSQNTAPQLKTTCSGNQTCTNGSCTNNNNNCTYHSYQQCVGSYLYWYDSCGNQQDSQYCSNGCYNNSCSGGNNYLSVQTNSATNVYNNQATLNGYLYAGSNTYNCNSYVWFQYGPTSSYGSETTHQLQNYSGNFSQIVNLYNSYNNNSYHFRAAAQNCAGNIVYGQDTTTYNNNNYSGSLTVTETVRNLSNGSGFANTVNAVPGDVLLFMITLQAGGQDVQNVFVRDYLPSNLIYNNQLVVSGSSYNYSGNITSGINLGTISAGQTVTVTYQVQVAGASNFAYGSTTLNDNISVTSSSANNPVNNASVVVTRSAVYGASIISTGLTNNLWVDSFFLPLLLTLICIWLWKSGMLFGIEKWINNKSKTHKGYKAEKELKNRIALIQEIEEA